MATTTLQTFEADGYGGLQEHFFRYTSTIGQDHAIDVLFRSSVHLIQALSSWSGGSDVLLNIQLPSGTEYTLLSKAEATSFKLNYVNDAETSGPGYMVVVKLPAGSLVRVKKTDSGTLSQFQLSLVTHPA